MEELLDVSLTRDTSKAVVNGCKGLEAEAQRFAEWRAKRGATA